MSYINVLEILGENIHFDISGYFDIFEFDIEGVDCRFFMDFKSIWIMDFGRSFKIHPAPLTTSYYVKVVQLERNLIH